MLAKPSSPLKPSSTRSQPIRNGSISSTTSSLSSRVTTPKSRPITKVLSNNSKSQCHQLRTDSSVTNSQRNNSFVTDNLSSQQQMYISLASEASPTNMLSDMVMTPGESYKKLVEEMAILHKELDQKNSKIEKLMAENNDLHKELEEFLSTVDDARNLIDFELRDCNKRIQELEAEIKELRSENKFYKEQLSKKTVQPKGILKDKQAKTMEVELYHHKQKEMEMFYSEINDQFFEFMDAAKKQYLDFNSSMQSKLQSTKGERLSTLAGSSDVEKSNLYLSTKTYEEKIMASQAHAMSVSMSLSSMGNSSPLTNANTQGSRTNSDQKKGQSVRFAVDSRVSSQSPLNRSAERKGSKNSVSIIDTEPRINSTVLASSGSDSKKSNISTSSPNSDLLRTKLRSDRILQEMKKKLSER